MTNLNSLPVELICEIFQHVHDACKTSHDLYNVSLLGRKYYPAARDVLYRAPRLLNPKLTGDSAWYYRTRHQLRGLLRTILSHPHLAKQICELEVTVTLVSFQPLDWKPHPLDDIGTINIDNDMVQGLPYASVDWIDLVRSGDMPATCALILALLPSLRCLSLQAVRIYLSHFGASDMVMEDVIAIHEWFGLQPSLFKSSAIAGLRNLRKLKMSQPYQPSVLNQASLEALELTAPHFQLGNEGIQLTNVTAVTLHEKLRTSTAIDGWQVWVEGAEEGISNSVPYLPALNKLRLIITGAVGPVSSNASSIQSYCFRPFNAPNLRMFVYDTRAVSHYIPEQTPRPSPVEALFLRVLHGFAGADDATQLQKVEMWPGHYGADNETAFTLPETLRAWSAHFTMYSGDSTTLSRVEEGDSSSKTVWPRRIVYLKD